MEPIRFYAVDDVKDHIYEYKGVLNVNGVFKGESWMGREIAHKARTMELDLTDENDRQSLIRLFTGTFVYAEEHESTENIN